MKCKQLKLSIQFTALSTADLNIVSIVFNEKNFEWCSMSRSDSIDHESLVKTILYCFVSLLAVKLWISWIETKHSIQEAHPLKFATEIDNFNLTDFDCHLAHSTLCRINEKWPLKLAWIQRIFNWYFFSYPKLVKKKIENKNKNIWVNLPVTNRCFYLSKLISNQSNNRMLKMLISFKRESIAFGANLVKKR